MSGPARLTDFYALSAERFPQHIALQEADGHHISYAQLHFCSLQLAAQLQQQGISAGMRIGILVPKSVESVMCILAVLHCECAYVPIDPDAPGPRIELIKKEAGLAGLLADSALFTQQASVVYIESRKRTIHFIPCEANPERTNDPACILYTSGSTGVPKGVQLTQENVLAFVNWALRTFPLSEKDVFVSHAPFHFDLSLFDLFAAAAVGASVQLISEADGRNPLKLAARISENRITVWYSTPTVLNSLMQFGKPERHDHSSLRLVLFAGEVFPIVQLRRLKQRWNSPRFFNLYGPTETNVCTWFEIPQEISAEQTQPFPIGTVCDQLEALICNTNGEEAMHGTVGELCISGPNVTPGYWNHPELNAQVFVERDQRRWYRTGDYVRRNTEGQLIFVGRRDRMVKRRGFRIELDEIEQALHKHPGISAAAVLAVTGTEEELRIRACICGTHISQLDVRAHCAAQLPAYMIPDEIVFLEELPRTSTGKTDYKALG